VILLKKNSDLKYKSNLRCIPRKLHFIGTFTDHSSAKRWLRTDGVKEYCSLEESYCHDFRVTVNRVWIGNRIYLILT
jgi:hypothetical protein